MSMFMSMEYKEVAYHDKVQKFNLFEFWNRLLPIVEIVWVNNMLQRYYSI